jgi:single-stranded-DNA-specific exonuclease
LPAFREAFEACARATLTDQDLVPRCRIDAIVAPDELTETLAEALQQLAPFGAGNPEPVLAALRLQTRPKLLAAKTGGPAHLKLAIEGARHLDVIGFGMAEQAALADAPVDAAFHLGVDEFNRVRRLSLRLKSLRPAG